MQGDATNKQLIQQIYTDLAAGNSRSFIACLADDVQWTVMGRTPWSKTYHGKQAVLKDLLGELRARLADRYRATAHRIIADAEYVAVEARGQATTKAGVPYNNEYCFIYRLESGIIKGVTEYLDT